MSTSRALSFALEIYPPERRTLLARAFRIAAREDLERGDHDSAVRRTAFAQDLEDGIRPQPAGAL